MRIALVLMLLAPLACAPVRPAGADPDFGAHWHDGKAELDGYRFMISRYGEPRTGEAVMVFVTEPFSRSQRVKLDAPSRNPADAVDVLKLNLVRDFQTGIYDYNTMVSVFSRSDDFAPLKVSMSSSEWCGNVYEEWIVHERTVDQRVMSYFEGESGTFVAERHDGDLLEDNLYIRLRGLRGAFLPPGGRTETMLLPGALVTRLTHTRAKEALAVIERRAASERVTVPAGAFDVIVYTVRTPERDGRFDIEQAWPHRIVRWSWTPRGERAGRGVGGSEERGELTGSARLEYWTLHANGDERWRREIGLPERAAP